MPKKSDISERREDDSDNQPVFSGNPLEALPIQAWFLKQMGNITCLLPSLEGFIMPGEAKDILST